jgi:CRISPR associated protein Cas1
MHADMRSRDGLVLDLMEPARPIADHLPVRMCADQAFRRGDFAEDNRGVIRILSPMNHRLAEAMPSFGSSLALIVERVATMLGDASPNDVSTPTALTRSKHRATARRAVGQRSRDATPIEVDPQILASRLKRRQRPPAPGIAILPWPVCGECGEPVPAERGRRRPRGRLCPTCQPARRREMSESVAAGRGAANTHADEAQARRRTGDRGQSLADLPGGRDLAWRSCKRRRCHTTWRVRPETVEPPLEGDPCILEGASIHRIHGCIPPRRDSGCWPRTTGIHRG